MRIRPHRVTRLRTFVNFLRLKSHLRQIPATPNWTRSTSSSRTSNTRSNNKSGKSCSSSRKRKIKKQQNKTTKPKGSKSSSVTSNKRSNYSKGISSKINRCSRECKLRRPDHKVVDRTRLSGFVWGWKPNDEGAPQSSGGAP